MFRQHHKSIITSAGVRRALATGCIANFTWLTKGTVVASWTSTRTR